jgi:hypothetical protein
MEAYFSGYFLGVSDGAVLAREKPGFNIARGMKIDQSWRRIAVFAGSRKARLTGY